MHIDIDPICNHLIFYFAAWQSLRSKGSQAGRTDGDQVGQDGTHLVTNYKVSKHQTFSPHLSLARPRPPAWLDGGLRNKTNIQIIIHQSLAIKTENLYD